MDVSCYCSEIVVGFTVANVAGTEDLLDFAWNEKLLEL